MKTIILEIGETRTNGGYPFKISIVGEQGTRVESLSPITDQDIDRIPAAPGLPGAGSGNRELGGEGDGEHGSTDYKNHAESLHDLLLRNDVLEKLRALGVCAEGSRMIKNCRLVLDVKAPTLRLLRFEMMCKGPNRPAMQPDCSVVRGPIKLAEREPPRDGPIRLLVVVGSGPKAELSVKAEAELRELKKVLAENQSELILRVLDRDRIRSLIAAGEVKNIRGAVKLAYQQFSPHIFHFIGHGNLGADKMPYLVLHDETEGDTRWTCGEMIADFNRVPPAFIFLNACYTVNAVGGEGGRSIADIFLAEIGSRGMLGMHSAIRGETAGKLAGSLYKAFLEGRDIDLALTEARGDADILKGKDRSREWDWAIPYLRLRVLPDEVIPVRFIPEPWRDRIRRSRGFKENKYFIDREPHRDEFWKWVSINPHDSGRVKSSNVVLIRGKSDIGKTQLMCFCLEAAAISGRLLKYVNFSGKQSLDWIGVLKRIIDGTEGSLTGSPLPPDLFAQFRPILDREGPMDQQDQILKEFRAALWKVPAAAREARAALMEAENNPGEASRVSLDRRPFVIVLDQLIGRQGTAAAGGSAEKAEAGVIPELFKKLLIEGLLQPINERRERDLQLVLAVLYPEWPGDRKEYEELGLDQLDPEPPAIAIQEIEPGRFATFAREYLERTDIYEIFNRLNVTREVQGQLVSSLTSVAKASREHWSPCALNQLYCDIKRFVGVEC